jgi:hypothetical protein
MRARKPLYLFLSLAVGLGLAAFLIHALLSRPASSLKPLPALEMASRDASESRPSSTVNATDAAPETLLVDEGTARESATQPAVEAADRSENFALEGARELLVRVDYPAGTPATEDPALWLIARENAEIVDPRELSMLQGMDPDELRAAKAHEDLADEDRTSFWSRRSLDSSHRAHMPFPPEAKQLVVLLEGNYLYLANLEVLDASSVPGSTRPRRCLHGHCVPHGSAARRRPHHVSGEVRLNGMGARGGRRAAVRARSRSRHGEFDARAVPADTSLVFEVEIENLVSEQQVEFLRLAPGELHEVEAHFRLGSSIRGRVVDPTGKAVANATVWSDGNGRGQFGWRPSQNKTTDEEGRFALHGISAGERRVHADAAGWKGGQSEALTLGEEQDVADLTVTLETGARIAGKVRWPDATPAHGARVLLHQDQGQRGYRWRNTVGTETAAEDGSFAFTGLSDGSYSLEASAERETESHEEAAKGAGSPSHLARWIPSRRERRTSCSTSRRRSRSSDTSSTTSASLSVPSR